MTRFPLLLLASIHLFGCGLVTDFDFGQNVPVDAPALDAATLDAPMSDAQPAIDGGVRFDGGLDAMAADAGSDAGSDAGCDPSSELCDGMDSDCDGIIDEGPTTGSSACPPCTIERTADDVYLFCSGMSVAHATARNACQDNGYQLAKLDRREAIDLVRRVAEGTDRWWIGLNDMSLEGTYVWEDGTGLGTASGWAPSQPANSATRDCVSFSGEDVGWVSSRCDGNNRYICSLR